MNATKTNLRYFLNNRTCIFVSAIFLVISGCQKTMDKSQLPDDINTDAQLKKSVKQKKNFVQINLVANNAEYPPARIDPVLINAWGLAFSPNGIAWIGAQGGHVSTVYNSEGVQVRPPVNIPSPGGPTGGNPTGVVFSSSNTDFILPAPNNQPARFLFV